MKKRRSVRRTKPGKGAGIGVPPGGIQLSLPIASVVTCKPVHRPGVARRFVHRLGAPVRVFLVSTGLKQGQRG